MIKLEPRYFSDLSFPDESVILSVFDPSERRFVAALSGAYTEDLVLESVRLEIVEWSAISIAHHLEDGLAYIDTLPDEFYSIDGFVYSEETIKVAGFLTSAVGWLDITFIGARMSVEYVGERL